MPEREASVLFVEGNDDLHAIKHLLLRHGVDCRQINVEIKRGAGAADAGAGAGGVHRVLEAMDTAIMTSAGRSVGFVLDADEVAQDRWRAVCGRIEGVGVSLPNDIPGGGFVAEAELAWQERPGLPYGSAIAARYFNHDSSAALAFVDWFKRVFDDSSLLRM